MTDKEYYLGRGRFLHYFRAFVDLFGTEHNSILLVRCVRPIASQEQSLQNFHSFRCGLSTEAREQTACAFVQMSSPALLPGWEAHTDDESGDVFYHNEATDETRWEAPLLAPEVQQKVVTTPVKLPPGWTTEIDEDSGDVFFHNEESGEVSWEPPVFPGEGTQSTHPETPKPGDVTKQEEEERKEDDADHQPEPHPEAHREVHHPAPVSELLSPSPEVQRQPTAPTPSPSPAPAQAAAPARAPASHQTMETPPHPHAPKLTAFQVKAYGKLLFDAADQGNAEGVRGALEECSEPLVLNFNNELHRTPLCAAAWKGHIDCLKLLLACDGVDCNAQDHEGEAAIHAAARMGHFPALELLLAQDERVDVNSCSRLGSTALCHAAAEGHAACVELLLTHDEADADLGSPLHHACAGGHADCAALLLEANRGVDVNATHDFGETALAAAASAGHAVCLQLLLRLSFGADVNRGDREGLSPLHLAVANGHTDCVRLLLAHANTDINCVSLAGRTPLSFVAEWSSRKTVRPELKAVLASLRVLMERKDLDVNLGDAIGRPPLFHFLRPEASCGDMIAALLQARPDTEVLVGPEAKPVLLRRAADACAYTPLRLLLEFAEREGHGARLDMRDLLLKTLHAAQAAEDEVDASFLIFMARHDVLLGGQHRDLWTTLVNGSHYHSRDQCAEVAEPIFDSAPDVHLQHRLAHALDRDGRAAMAIAPERLRRRMREALLFCGRYELARGAQPEHVSSSSLFFATDLGQALDYEEAFALTQGPARQHSHWTREGDLTFEGFRAALERVESMQHRCSDLLPGAHVGRGQAAGQAPHEGPSNERRHKTRRSLPQGRAPPARPFGSGNEEEKEGADEEEDDMGRLDRLQDLYEASDEDRSGGLSRDEFVSCCERTYGPSRTVAIKFMRNEKQFQREILVRSSHDDSPIDLGGDEQSDSSRLDGRFVCGLLKCPTSPAVLEREIADKLIKTGIVPALEGYRFALVMPAADRSLETIFRCERPGLETVRVLALDVARCLEHCHARSVLHGDVKMSNAVRLEGRVCLVDLDASCVFDKDEPEHGDLFGAKFSSGVLPPEMFHVEPLEGPDAHDALAMAEQYWRRQSGQDACDDEHWQHVAPRVATCPQDGRQKVVMVKSFRTQTQHDAQYGAAIDVPLLGGLPYRPLPASPAVDVWAFGCLLFHLCCGESLLPTTDRDDDLSTALDFLKAATWTDATLAARLAEIPLAGANAGPRGMLLLSLLSRIFRADPAQRLPSMKAVLAHPFFSRGSSEVGKEATGPQSAEAAEWRARLEGSRLAQPRTHVDNLTVRLQQKEEEIQHLSEHLQQQEEDMHHSTERLQEQEEEIQALLERNAALEAATAAATATAAAATRRPSVSGAIKGPVPPSERIRDLEAELTARQDELGTLEAEVASLREAAEAAAARAAQDLASLSARLQQESDARQRAETARLRLDRKLEEKNASFCVWLWTGGLDDESEEGGGGARPRVQQQYQQQHQHQHQHQQPQPQPQPQQQQQQQQDQQQYTPHVQAAPIKPALKRPSAPDSAAFTAFAAQPEAEVEMGVNPMQRGSFRGSFRSNNDKPATLLAAPVPPQPPKRVSLSLTPRVREFEA